MNSLHLTLGNISFVLLSGCILLNAIVGASFIFRKSKTKRADYFFAAFQFAFGLTTLHHLFILKGIYSSHPGLLFVPVYFTLSLGALLFFSVKFWLFPNYRFVGTDAKHFVFPVGQFLYFLLIFLFTDVAFRHGLGRKFYSPFYGGLEMALYIASFYGYQFGAYRYIRYKLPTFQNQDDSRQLHETLYLRKLLRVMVILFWVNSAYIVTDFVMYELLRLNMHNLRGFTRFGELSFAAMAGWAGWIGWKLLTKQAYTSQSGQAFSLLKKILEETKGRRKKRMEN